MPTSGPRLSDVLSGAPGAIILALLPLNDKRNLRLGNKAQRAAVDASVCIAQLYNADNQAATLTRIPWTGLRSLAVYAPCRIGGMLEGSLQLEKLEHLLLFISGLAERDVVALAQANWPELRTLSLLASREDFMWGEQAMRALVYANWPHLQALRIGGDISAAGVAALVTAQWPCLQKLQLTECMLGENALLQLAGANWPLLHTLFLSHNNTGPDTRWLGRVTWPLRRLRIKASGLGPDFAATLASVDMPQLEELDLSSNRLGCSGAIALTTARWPLLRRLNLSGNGIGPKGAAPLASAAWPLLEELNLCANELGAQGAAALTTAEWPALRMVNLARNRLWTAGCRALAGAVWHHLMQLDLSHNWVGMRGALALCSAHWPELRTLTLKGERLSLDRPASTAAWVELLTALGFDPDASPTVADVEQQVVRMVQRQRGVIA